MNTPNQLWDEMRAQTEFKDIHKEMRGFDDESNLIVCKTIFLSGMAACATELAKSDDKELTSNITLLMAQMLMGIHESIVDASKVLAKKTK